jgi:plasmid stabilization system protein ParE
MAPLRGQQRDDLRQNLRILPIDKNAVVAFEVNEERCTVTILNIFYGGRDYDAIIKPV